MFFGLDAVDDHPCCKMQDVVEAFFFNSIDAPEFSVKLFPDWFRKTLDTPPRALKGRFMDVYTLLHAPGDTRELRVAVYDQVLATNRIQDLCDGTHHLPADAIDWESELGKAVIVLMSTLYDSLDFAVFRRSGQTGLPTHQLYGEFIKKNKYICPFCGLGKFKNRLGPRREDFDHYMNKSTYPLASSNMKNLVPTCGTCNQDYKKARDILADGVAFYPYAVPPEIRLEVECNAYPAPDNLSDTGQWSVKLELSPPDATVLPKMAAWNRVYSIKTRLENEIAEFFEDWMAEMSDEVNQPIERAQFLDLIETAKKKAVESSQRRMQPSQIIKAAFFDFMLVKAEEHFVESFRRLQNGKFTYS